ncbi:MAG: M60 family metallopeptidase [Rikenellaceae bacterium]
MKKILSTLAIILSATITFAATAPKSSQPIDQAITSLVKQIEGASTLNAAQIDAAAELICESMPTIVDHKQLLTKTFDLVDSYESSDDYGPLFLSQATRNGLTRQNRKGKEIHFAMLNIQQGLLDHAYTSQRLKEFYKLLNNRKFETSSYFPGAVAPPKDRHQSHTATINASNRVSWGAPTSNEKAAAKRPTGCYLAPGSIARVVVPESMVDCGFNVRVGAHSWDHSNKPTIKRLDRVSLLYPITSTQTLIGSPLGGGIYIEVPYMCDLGVVEIEIINAVRSPYFSARSFAQTTNEEWRTIERNNPGAWADFESDDFMMQVPTSWITNYYDPTTLMADWDKSMKAVFDLRGLDREEFDKTLLYVQIDVQMRGSANFPGYPQANYTYNPMDRENGNKQHWMLSGPKEADWTVLHELGHSILISKFRGETEAIVNFITVASLNRAVGVDLDTAFGLSVNGQWQLSLDDVAVMWLTTETFRQGKEMNYSNVPGDEFKYQHRGYAKYVEIVDLFGWEALDKFWHNANVDYMGERLYYPRETNRDPVDSRIFHLSQAAGYDLTPLIHFWGIHPMAPQRLKSRLAEAGLAPSAEIYDRLIHYLEIIPRNNEEFKAHTKVVYPKGLKVTAKSNPLFGEGWYNVWYDRYNEEHYNAARESLESIISLYFPEGRP